jgi:hypothetical protein
MPPAFFFGGAFQLNKTIDTHTHTHIQAQGKKGNREFQNREKNDQS